MARQPTPIYQIKVTLDRTRPPIWRRILVPANVTLLKLHDIVQIVMGWQDYHLHEFTRDGLTYGNPDHDDFGYYETINSAKVKLSQVLQAEGQRLRYEYDFGDSWQHTLLLEKILPKQKGVVYPICVKGRRSCPPEDVGGVWGYKNFLEAIRNPDHKEHEEYLTWIGGAFDPEMFDLEAVNGRLRTMGRGWSTESSNPWAFPPYVSPMAFSARKAMPLDIKYGAAEALPLRRDVLSLVTYVRDHKITGTQSTGNFPLKAVSEICALFVDPPELSTTIGEQTFRARSETEVWPLYFRHVLAVAAGLIRGGPGQRWRVTEVGKDYLTHSPAHQVWLLLIIWFTRINWAIASPFGLMGGQTPPGFTRLTLYRLLDLPVNEPVPFQVFADRLINDSGLVWPIKDQESGQRILQSIIKRMVINPLLDFGLLVTEYRPDEMLGPDYPHLTTLTVTTTGQEILAALKESVF